MKFKQKLLSVALVIGLITGNTCVSLADTQQLEVHHINVGQGESIYIEFPDGTDALIDAGKSNSGDTVVNYLKSQESDIDLEYLIATHPDADHIGGMKSVFEDLNVKNFIYPKDTQNNSSTWKAVLSLANKEGCTINDSTPGSTFDIGGATMKFIQSPKDFTDNNDDSVVTYLDYKNTKFLFTGDIESEAENDMVNRGLVPDVDFMSVPHHGSRGSSTQEFLNKAKPEYAVISVGKNSYGHPTQDALNRYANIGTKLYRTDIDGSVVIKTDGISNTINKSNESLEFNDDINH